MPDNEDMEQEHMEDQAIPAPGLGSLPALTPTPVVTPSTGSGWDWVGSPSYPAAQESSDGISDLFGVSDEDIGASDSDLSDLTDVDVERDVLDADDDGSLDDLVSVTEEDIMGDELGQRPSAPPSRQAKARYRLTPRYQPPTSIRRSGG